MDFQIGDLRLAQRWYQPTWLDHRDSASIGHGHHLSWGDWENPIPLGWFLDTCLTDWWDPIRPTNILEGLLSDHSVWLMITSPFWKITSYILIVATDCRRRWKVIPAYVLGRHGMPPILLFARAWFGGVSGFSHYPLLIGVHWIELKWVSNCSPNGTGIQQWHIIWLVGEITSHPGTEVDNVDSVWQGSLRTMFGKFQASLVNT